MDHQAPTYTWERRDPDTTVAYDALFEVFRDWGTRVRTLYDATAEHQLARAASTFIAPKQRDQAFVNFQETVTNKLVGPRGIHSGELRPYMADLVGHQITMSYDATQQPPALTVEWRAGMEGASLPPTILSYLARYFPDVPKPGI